MWWPVGGFTYRVACADHPQFVNAPRPVSRETPDENALGCTVLVPCFVRTRDLRRRVLGGSGGSLCLSHTGVADDETLGESRGIARRAHRLLCSACFW